MPRLSRFSHLKNNQQSGQIIILALVFLGVLLMMSSGLLGYSTIQIKAGRLDYADAQALNLAEAGLDNAISKMNLGSYAGESNTALGPGTFTVALNSVDTNDKIIVSTGYVPNATAPIATRTVQAEINFNSTAIGFGYGMQIGLGGLSMAGRSAINGNVYSDGSILAGAPKDNPLNGTVVVASGVATTPDQSEITQNVDRAIGDTTAHTDLAMAFTPSTSNTLGRISLYLKTIGSPGDLTMQVMRDNAGVPSTTAIASANVLASGAGTAYTWMNIGLSGIPALTAGTKYWIMLMAPAVNSNNYWSWGGDSANSYAGGDGYYSSQWNAAPTPTWSAASADLDFNMYLGGAATSLVGGAISGDAKAHSMSGCTITGNAFYATTNSCTTGGTSTSGQTDQPYQPLPITDAQIANWEAIASTGPTFSGSPYSISGTAAIGPAVINSDVDVTGTLDLTGPVWVKGNASFHSASKLTVDASLGDAGAVLILDKPSNPSTSGLASLVSGTVIVGNGNPHSFPMVLSNSTSTTAISLAGNGSGVVLYAPRGTVNVSGNGVANQVTGNAIVMSSSATITYNTGLSNANFLNGPGGAWIFTPGTYVITK